MTDSKLKQERDEADRRAGAAERELAEAKTAIYKLHRQRDNQKIQAGYDTSESFDFVWAETLKKVNSHDKLKDDIAFIKRWVQRVYDKETTLGEFYGVLHYYEPLKPAEAVLEESTHGKATLERLADSIKELETWPEATRNFALNEAKASANYMTRAREAQRKEVDNA